MFVDHIFIFCDSKKEADKLVEFGLTEGTGRKHQGIGTANRRFFFDNFYLEILWVENDREAKSVQDIGIWERANYKNSGYSPYGLCLKNTPDTNCVFENAIKWEPLFLPKGKHVDIVTDERMLWIFRFPSSERKNIADEPTTHSCAITKLSKVIFNLSQMNFESTLKTIRDNSIVEFKKASTNGLILEFDNLNQGKSKTFENFNLVIKY